MLDILEKIEKETPGREETPGKETKDQEGGFGYECNICLEKPSEIILDCLHPYCYDCI